MRKHSGPCSRHRPSFDLLEERSLLSGGSPPAPGPGPGSVLPPGSIPIPFGLIAPGGYSQPVKFQPGAGTVFFDELPSVVTDFDVYSAPPTTPGTQTDVAMGFISQGPAFTKNPTGAMEPNSGAPVAFNAQVANVVVDLTAGSNRNETQNPTEAGNNPIGLTVSGTPVQVVAVFDGVAAGTARRFFPDGSDDVGNPLVGIGPGRDRNGGASNPRATIRSRASLSATADVSANPYEGNADALPGPSGVDLLATALPFDRNSLARAVDQLFHQFENLSADDVVWQHSTQLALSSLAVASTLAALNTIRRRWSRWSPSSTGRGRDPGAVSDHIGFPELPGSWSSRLS